MLMLLGFMIAPTMAWWNSSYPWRQGFNASFTNNMTDKIIAVNVTWDAEMNSNFSDIRVVNATDNGVLNFAILDDPNFKSDGSWSIIFIRGNWNNLGGVGFYIYAGNSTFGEFSSPWTTFKDYDDFGDASINATLWKSIIASGATITESGGVVTIINAGATDTYLLSNDNAFNINMTLIGRINFTAFTSQGMFGAVNNTNPAATPMVLFQANYPTASVLNARSYVSGAENTNLGTPVTANAFNTFEITRNGTVNNVFYVNRVLNATHTTELSTHGYNITFGMYSANLKMQADYVALTDYIWPEPNFTALSEEYMTVLSYSPSYPYINQNVNFTLANVTASDFWWSFGDGNESYYTTISNVLHPYSNNQVYSVNATYYDGASNQTVSNINVTVYDRLSGVNITAYDFIPALFINTSQVLTATISGGAPTNNYSWIVATGTNYTYADPSPLTITLNTTGTQTAYLTVCDTTDGNCTSNTTQFRVWNVTGGALLVNSFNKTSRLLAQTLYGDYVTWNSTDSLNWTLMNTTKSGTSASFVLNSTNAFYNNTDYYHYNVSVNMSWGSYEKAEWFTAITANYLLNQSHNCTANLYCIVGGKMYNNVTQLTTGTLWYALLETSAGVAHSQESGITTSNNELNVTMCMNATPLISTMLLNGVITYSATGYAERTYAFLDANISLSTTCTTVNGKYMSFYTIPSGDASEVTITVLQGGISLPDAIVKIQEFDVNWYTVASQVTDSNGQVQMNLKLCPTYYKIVVEQDGDSLYSEKTCLKSTSHEINIDTETAEWYQIWEDVITSCTWDNVTEYLSCSVSDTSGRTVMASLVVRPSWSTTEICSESEASTTTTLVCDMGPASYGDYRFELSITTSTDTYIVNTGSFTKGTQEDLGDDAALAAFMIFISAVISIANPVVAVAFGTLFFVGASATGLITMTGASVSWLLAVTIIILVRLMI